MVNLKITAQKVHKVLINNVSLENVLFTSTLDRMNLVSHIITPVRTSLDEFSGESINIEGELELPIKLGNTPVNTSS